MLKISWTERRTNEEVLQGVGVGRELMSTVRRRQMHFLGHVTRREGLEHLSLTGKIEGKRPQGRSRQKYMDGLVQVTVGGMSAAQLIQATRDREQWQTLVADVLRDMARQ